MELLVPKDPDVPVPLWQVYAPHALAVSTGRDPTFMSKTRFRGQLAPYQMETWNKVQFQIGGNAIARSFSCRYCPI